MSFKPDFIYHLKVFNVIFYSIDYLDTIFFPIFCFSFHYFLVGLKRQTSIHLLLYEVFVQPLRILVQSEPRSHTEHVHFEPSPFMVRDGRIKDFHIVRAYGIVYTLLYLVLNFVLHLFISLKRQTSIIHFFSRHLLYSLAA